MVFKMVPGTPLYAATEADVPTDDMFRHSAVGNGAVGTYKRRQNEFELQ